MTQFDKFSHALAQLPAPIASQPPDEWLDVRAPFRVIRRRGLLVLLVAVAAMAASLPSILQMKKEYSAQLRLLIYVPNVTEIGSGKKETDDRLNVTTEVERLLSQAMAVRVVEHFSLADRPEFNPALRKPDLRSQLQSALKTSFLGEADVEDEDEPDLNPAVMEFRDHLSVFRFGNSDVLSIGFLSEDPQLAAAVPNTLLQLYLEERRAAFANEFKAATSWFDARIEEQRAKADIARNAVEKFRDAPEFTSPEALGASQALVSLTVRRSEIDRNRELLKRKLEALDTTEPPEEKAVTVDSEQLRDLSRDFGAKQNELAALRKSFGENHAKVVAARARLSGLRVAMERELLAYRDGLVRDLALLDAEQARIADQSDDAQADLAKMNAYEAELGHRQRLAQREQDTLLDLQSRRDAVFIESERPSLEAEVLSPASVPEYPDGRGKSFYAVVALIASIMLGLSAAFVREMFDNSVRSHDQLRKVPGLAAVGMVPRTSRRALRSLRDPGSKSADSVYVDAIRGLALSLDAAAGGKRMQSLAVISAVPGEGSSTLAAALAFEISATRNVLIVDCDLKRGTVHQHFAADPAPGLSDYLAGTAELADVIRTDGETGIRFVTRGSTRRRAVPTKRALQTLVQAAHASGEFVIFDGAPALATSSSVLLAGVTDRTLLVVRWGRTAQEAVAAAVERIGGVCAADILCVINRVNLRRQALYGYRDAGVVAKTQRKYYALRA